IPYLAELSRGYVGKPQALSPLIRKPYPIGTGIGEEYGGGGAAIAFVETCETIAIVGVIGTKL
ncbi:MAG: hypothetical protein FD120_2558, partial [Gammaproteobacteria bacterium]